MSSNFYNTLKTKIYHSNSAERSNWVNHIVKSEVPIEQLAPLLLEDKKVATRFAWLISEIGIQSPNTLLKYLPYLLEFRRQVNHFKFNESFANYWRIAGIPPINEGQATEMLFDWMQSPTTNVTIKSRAAFVLLKLAVEYPELKNEVRLCVESQLDQHTKDFEKRCMKILKKLN